MDGVQGLAQANGSVGDGVAAVSSRGGWQRCRVRVASEAFVGSRLGDTSRAVSVSRNIA